MGSWFLKPMVLSLGITYRKPPTKIRHAINNGSLEKEEEWKKNEYVTEYVVEHVPQHGVDD
jgi:hypothetical protein